MQPTSEKWEMKIGKDSFIISGQEKEMIVNAGEARFVKFRDMVINPAFVVSMVKIESQHVGEIAAPYEGKLSDEEWFKNHSF